MSPVNFSTAGLLLPGLLTVTIKHTCSPLSDSTVRNGGKFIYNLAASLERDVLVLPVTLGEDVELMPQMYNQAIHRLFVDPTFILT